MRERPPLGPLGLSLVGHLGVLVLVVLWTFGDSQVRRAQPYFVNLNSGTAVASMDPVNPVERLPRTTARSAVTPAATPPETLRGRDERRSLAPVRPATPPETLPPTHARAQSPSDALSLAPLKALDPVPPPAPPPEPERPHAVSPPLATPQPPTTPEASRVSLDVGDVPFTYYLRQLQAKISQRWTPPGPATPGQAKAIVVFAIARDGSIAEPALEQSSGNARYDESALRAVAEAVPLPPLPLEFKPASLRVHLGFEVAPEG